jgi:hypothetical protein
LIDRYCIPQIDEQAKSELINLMDKIHNCSSLTLIACGGDVPQHDHTGIGRARAITPYIRGYKLVPTVNDIISSVWASRGRTFQETLMSRRQLYFTDRQLIFQGEDFIDSGLTVGSNVDCGSTQDPLLPFAFFTTVNLDQNIFQCIQEHSRWTLTRPGNDRLMSLHDIFLAYEFTGLRHLWCLSYAHTSHENGLFLVSSLCWHVAVARQPGARHGMFPTWSWASCLDAIYY